jgi:hypothetical protein
MSEMKDQVWVFHGEGAQFASAVFRSQEAAVRWIGERALSGVLTAYPLDMPAYDWAVEAGHFKPKSDDHKSPRFIQRFTSGAQAHLHFTDGKSA